MKKVKKTEQEIEKALLSKALGCTTQEVVEEYGFSGEEFVIQQIYRRCKFYWIIKSMLIINMMVLLMNSWSKKK